MPSLPYAERFRSLYKIPIVRRLSAVPINWIAMKIVNPKAMKQESTSIAVSRMETSFERWLRSWCVDMRRIFLYSFFFVMYRAVTELTKLANKMKMMAKNSSRSMYNMVIDVDSKSKGWERRLQQQRENGRRKKNDNNNGRLY